ncbi:histidine phosphatase family protein [uncultured Salinisphaera sp.]|uniref:histidine phosphatase family protein n=1 Tax=uncultured Salinisphaera sp. TaxID=359372 RepID=UPI0032B25E53|tara:strand:- start:207 stop:842 length:636 start_codon:yes stop_codon:yes gene_type:complete
MAEATTTLVDLLRHGECEGGPIFRGSLDVALSEAGLARMQAQADAQPGWQHVIASPLRRCRFFAERLAAARGLSIEIDARLREIDFGRWEGRPVSEVWRDDADAAQAWFDDPEHSGPPGGEALRDLRDRARAAFDDAVHAHAGRHLVLVAHGGLIRALLADLLDMPGAAMHRIEVPYACLTRLRVVHDEARDFIQLVAHNIDFGAASSCAR